MKKKFGTAAAIVAVAMIAALTLASCSTYKWLTLEEYAAALKASDSFTEGVPASRYGEEGINVIDYGFDDADNLEVRETYGLISVAGGGDTLSKTLNILAFVADKVKHDGGNRASVEKENAKYLLEYAYEKSKGINCLQLAIVLRDCLQSIGIKARAVMIMPEAADSGDNHVVTQAYLDESERWVVVDPSYGAAFQNAAGEYLDLFGLRTAIANGEEVLLNESAHYNHNPVDKRDYLEYLAKNLYWFNGFVNTKNETYLCVPDGFDIRAWYLAQSEYLYKNGIRNKKMYEADVKYYTEYDFKTVSKALFLKP